MRREDGNKGGWRGKKQGKSIKNIGSPIAADNDLIQK